jgi:hypothetical protein
MKHKLRDEATSQASDFSQKSLWLNQQFNAYVKSRTREDFAVAINSGVHRQKKDTGSMKNIA